MKFGVVVPTRGRIATPDGMARLARHVDQLDYADIWVGDHIVLFEELDAEKSKYPMTSSGQYLGNAHEDMYECLTMLTYLGAITKNVRLGTNVFIVPTHNPVLTAKMLATLDVMTGGRVTLGTGVGWMQEEYELMGADFEQRGPVTTEYLRLMQTLWTEDRPVFDGKYYSVKPGVGFRPKPLQEGGIPIWTGGNSRAAVRRAAEIGSGWNAFAVAPDKVAELTGFLHEELDRLGRDRKEVTVSARLAFEISEDDGSRVPCRGPAEKIAEDLGHYRKAGVEHVILAPRRNFSDRDFMDQLERFRAEVIPLL